MSFDPTFRFYRDDPQERALATLAELFAEIDVELVRRRELYPWMVSKGRMTRADVDRELRVWSALWDQYRGGAIELPAKPPAIGAVATWTEQVHCLRREIALRRRLYPQWVEAGRLDADEATRKLLLVEDLHAMTWRFTWHDEAIAARAETDARGLAA